MDQLTLLDPEGTMVTGSAFLEFTSTEKTNIKQAMACVVNTVEGEWGAQSR